MSPRWVGALALAILVLSGCRAHRDLDPIPSPAAHDQGYLLYQARLEGAAKDRRFRLALAVQPPDRFRLEVIGPMGGPRLVLIADGSVVQASLPSKRVFARGPADSETFGVLTGLSVPPEVFLDLLLGFPDPVDQSSILRADRGAVSQVSVSFEAGWTIARSAEVLFGTTSPMGSRCQVTYGEETDGPWGLQAAELNLRKGEMSLSLRLKESSRGRVKPGAFSLVVPKSFSELSLERIAAAGTNLFAVEEGS